MRAGHERPLQAVGARSVRDHDGMKEVEPSDRVVEQRIRNRIIEYLDLAASYEAQATYQRAVPFVTVAYEVINQWDDCVTADPRDVARHPGVFSLDEVGAMCDFQAVLTVVTDAVPNDHPSLGDVQALPEWDRLRRAASTALAVFAVRGKMPEDHEVIE